ncbi:MAG TPA: hypothetical protein VGS80_01525, partial [Ktedonobacterales bacterium]|nr:hypothetical protein [Ktedonobacterales bacterium]
LRMQQEAELKQLRAETSAKVREAQLRGMASTAAAARQQAAGLLGRGKAEERQPAADEQTDETPATGSTDTQGDEPESGASKVLQYPVFTPGAGREAVNGRGLASFHNHAAAATPSVHSAPAAQAHTGLAQPALLANADVQGAGGLPSTDGFTFTPRRPASFSGTLTPADDMEDATGTTGPRPAIRRANEPGILTRGLNEPNPAHVQAVHEAMRSLNIPTSKRSLSAAQLKVLAPAVAERLTVDETSARTLINRVLKAEGQRTSQA